MEDETTSIFSQYRSDLTSMTYLPVPYFETFKRARHKDRTLKLAEQIGIPIPKTWYVEDLSQIAKLKDHLPYPVVIKPKIGSGAIGIHYPKNPREFVDRYTRVHRISPYPLIQDRIPVNGISYGASFLMDENGRVKASFVHRRIREYPVSGGASTLRESIRHDDIRDMGLSLLKALDWSGVAMVEFKVDPRDNTPKLMEINPRFWGSLALAVDAGVNFPYLMYRLSLGENFRPVEHYQIGKRCRWLLPGDILHFIRNPQRRKLMPHFFRFGDANTTYDILSLGDPLPSLARILTPLTFLYNKDMKQRLRKRKK
jgi:predicted ATP-grasp superfamily ATP-dependent carboligase